MNNNVTIRFGGLLKQEPLRCVEHDLPMKDTCVLEAVSPFFGYYDEIPSIQKPLYLYVMLEGYPFTADVMRMLQQAASETKFSFDAVYGSIKIPSYDEVRCLRIRHLEKYSDLSSLQNALINSGLEMKRKLKSFDHEQAMIRLEKFFYVEPTETNCWMDVQEAHHGYFEVPLKLSWEKFAALTREVKYDTSLQYFDAAQAFTIDGKKISDLVRIYKVQLSSSGLKDIANRYLHLYDRYISSSIG